MARNLPFFRFDIDLLIPYVQTTNSTTAINKWNLHEAHSFRAPTHYRVTVFIQTQQSISHAIASQRLYGTHCCCFCGWVHHASYEHTIKPQLSVFLRLVDHQNSSIAILIFFILLKKWKTLDVHTTDWMVKIQLCKLRGTLDLFFIYDILFVN